MRESSGRCGALVGPYEAAGADLDEARSVLESFVEEYGEKAYQFAFRLSGNVEEAKDLVQEAFCRMMRNWDRYDPSQSLDAWFMSIMKNIHLDHRRRFESRNVVSLYGNGGEEDSGPAGAVASGEEALLERLERGETASLVREALASLTPEHRDILTLCDVEGLTYDQIASVAGIPKGTVRSRVSRAREALRRALCQGPLELER